MEFAGGQASLPGMRAFMQLAYPSWDVNHCLFFWGSTGGARFEGRVQPELPRTLLFENFETSKEKMNELPERYLRQFGRHAHPFRMAT